MENPKFFYDINEVKSASNRSFFWGVGAGVVGLIILVSILEASGVLAVVEKWLQ